MTKDSGVSWITLLELDGIVDKTFYANNKIYFTSWTKDARSTTLYLVDLISLQVKILQNSELKIKDFYVEPNGDYWLIVDDSIGRSVLQKCSRENLMEVKVFPNSGKAIHKWGTFIAVLTYNVDGSILGGLGGTRYDLDVSFDDGDKWKHVPLPIDSYVKPYTFYRDRLFLGYSGDGNLTCIEFRDQGLITGQ